MTQTRSQNREPLASMRAEWLLQENKQDKISYGYNFFGREAKPPHVSRLEQWTPFTDGFCARGGVGGFYIGDFNNEDKPTVKFIPWKKVDNKEVRVTGIKPVSEGRFVAVVEDAKEDTLVILDAKSEDPAKPVASIPLADTRRGSERNFVVNIAIYDCKPEGFKLMIYRPIQEANFIFKPNRLSFQFTEGLNTLEAIGSLIHRYLNENNLCYDMLFVKNHYISQIHFKYSGRDGLDAYSLNQEYQCDDYDYALSRSYLTNPNHQQLYTHPQSDFLLVAADFLPTKTRNLAFWELRLSPDKYKDILVKLKITYKAQLFSNPIILPDNKVIYIGNQSDAGTSTIFLYDPACAAPAPIYEFDTQVEEIFLTPKGNMAVGYRDKNGAAVCEIYPLPQATLKEKETLAKVISEAYSKPMVIEVAALAADYAYEATQTWKDWAFGKQTLSPVTYPPCAVLKREGLFADGIEKALAKDRIKNIGDELEDLQQKLRISIFDLKSKYSEADETKARDELNSYRQIANERHTELPRLTQLQPCHPDLIRVNKFLDDKWENHFEEQINEIRKTNVAGMRRAL